MTDTIFGRIARGEVPAELVYESDDVIAFRDLNPQAPVHILVIPRQPIPSLDQVSAADAPLLGRLLVVAAEIARQEGIAADGYRTVINCNAAGGQTVYHLHVHLIGGRPLRWPPG